MKNVKGQTKMTKNPAKARSKPEIRMGEPTRLMSLLAMATGAIAMPQTSNADIVFTDFGGNPILVFGTNSASFLINTLPGTARIGFCGHSIVSPPMMLSTHSVRASQKYGYVRLKTDAAGFVKLAGAGLNWNQIPGDSSDNGTAAIARQNGHHPDPFDHLYMVFKFKNSTLPPGMNLRYGWIDLGLSYDNGSVPELKIYGYAYDDTGALIQTAVIPEPAPMAL